VRFDLQVSRASTRDCGSAVVRLIGEDFFSFFVSSNGGQSAHMLSACRKMWKPLLEWNGIVLFF
jgi:hypothetical protein